MDSILLQSLSMLAYQIPELLVALWAVLQFGLWTPAVPGRGLARIAAWLMLAACLLRGVLSVLQVVAIQHAQDVGSEIATRLSLLSAASMLVNLVFVAGLVLLILGARQAMRMPRAA